MGDYQGVFTTGGDRYNNARGRSPVSLDLKAGYLKMLTDTDQAQKQLELD